MKSFLEHWEIKLIKWLEFRGWSILRVSIGIIYLIFGLLKFFPQYSPAEDLAGQTINIITLGVIPPEIALMLLAVIETGIGLCFIFYYKFRVIIWITLWHMMCTFIPLIALPHFVYTSAPFSFSIVGQYIIKNLVIISAVLLLYAHYGRERRALSS